ncbi:MAG: methylisocitrate lyase [Alicyclobacillus sp.]|nr:methylisocitrate lyase [Alicyclobacillus sp.]
MTWFVEPEPSQQALCERLRERIRSGPILQLPGAHDGMSALLARAAGFEALYLSGAAYTASRGLPDLGVVYSNEVAELAQELVRAAKLPVLVDIDTGYGGVLNVARTAREMVEAGAAGVQMEDQELPKKCGHLNGKRLIPAYEMQQKIHMLKQTAPDLVVVARTDARAVNGMEDAVGRARAYVEAGADAIFPEALTTAEEFQQFRAAVDVPLLANMTEFGKTPYFTAAEFESWGYQMVIYPVTSLRAAAKAVESVYRDIRQTGTQRGALDALQTRKELYETIRYADYEALDERIAKTVLPQNPGGGA